MQVWNLLHTARWKYRTQKWRKKYLRTIAQLCQAESSQQRHVLTIRKKLVKQQYVLHMSPQYGELRPTSGWDRFGSLRHPSKFYRFSLLGSVTAQHSSSGCQPNFAVLNRGRHLYSAGWPSRWALAHIVVSTVVNIMTLVLQCSQLVTLTTVTELKTSWKTAWWRASLLVEDCNFELFLTKKNSKSCCDMCPVVLLPIIDVERYVCVCSMMSEDKKNSQRGMNVVVVNGQIHFVVKHISPSVR